MKYSYYTTDVFSNQIFNGAQVAVFPQAEGLDTRLMQLIARELNLPESVFILPAQNENSDRRIRIFSPEKELDFGGHPLLATGLVLAHSGEIELKPSHTMVRVEQNSGVLPINISQEPNKPFFIQFSLTVEPLVDYYVPSERELARILSVDEHDIENKLYTTRLVSCGLPYLVVPLRSYEAIRKARFNFAAWSESTAPQTAAQEILLVSNKTAAKESDFHVRLVGPNIRVHDDPAVGSAMPTLAAYLTSHTHLREGTYTFTVDRGQMEKRRSVLNLEMDHKGLGRLTVRIVGEAVLVSEGMMTVPG